MRFYLYNTDSDGLDYYEDKLKKFDVYNNPKELNEYDDDYREKSNIIELYSLDDLVLFSSNVGKKLIINIDEYRDDICNGAIEIYDYYRE